MAVSKRLYVMSLVLSLFAIAVIFGLVKYWDDSRLASVELRVSDSQEQIDSTRLLALYGQTLNNSNLRELCKLEDFSLKRQMDKSFGLINQLREFEKANLLSHYDQTRRRYYLSNFEMWLYAKQYNQKCAAFSNQTAVVLFLTQTASFCSDCLVQGELLDQIRTECPAARIITLASDLDLPPVSFLKEKYGIASSPSLLIDDQVLVGLQNKAAVKKQIGC